MVCYWRFVEKSMSWLSTLLKVSFWQRVDYEQEADYIKAFDWYMNSIHKAIHSMRF